MHPNEEAFLFTRCIHCFHTLTAKSQKPKPKDEDYEKVFTKTEKPAEFPGGPEGWRQYLEGNLQYPKKAQRKGIQGVVRIQFIVDRESNVSEVLALNDLVADWLKKQCGSSKLVLNGYLPSKTTGKSFIVIFSPSPLN